MSKISDRLHDYQTQMSVYAEQHKIILANDVLDMIEQLQEDLKDDIEKVVEELEDIKNAPKRDYPYNTGWKSSVECAIEVVRKGGLK